MGVADRGRVAEGDDRFDDAPVGGQFQPKAGFGLGFDRARGHVLGLDDDGGAARDGDDDVGAEAGFAGDGLGVLGTDLAAGHHVLEEAAEGVVGVGFRLSGHVGTGYRVWGLKSGLVWRVLG